MPTAPATLRYADHRLDEAQEALADVFSTFFERECPVERVRAAEPGGFDAALWGQLVDMAAPAMGVPEEAGGDGAGLADLVLVTEPLGRRLAPVPLVEVSAAARLLARCGPPATDTLAAALDGRHLVTLALHPGRPGQPQLVPAGAVADAVVALVGDELVLVTGTGRPAANHGDTPIAWWDLDGTAGSRTVLATGDEARRLVAGAVSEWKLLTAAALVGLADQATRIAIEHARTRTAFGAPIGTFQAVSHALVDVHMDTETARRLVRKAAWFADREPGTDGHRIPMAYLHAAETAMRAGTVGVHVLGGMGFTLEADEQLYFRRAKGWTLVAGDPRAELAAIADALYGPPTTR
ncbi:MAG TPA: acyl-CoA dehydrogenase [Acidimicrobiales bacterium]|nr:acyl-CoA dehydrogenase [Acidimicrobiales bacterium]